MIFYVFYSFFNPLIFSTSGVLLLHVSGSVEVEKLAELGRGSFHAGTAGSIVIVVVVVAARWRECPVVARKI